MAIQFEREQQHAELDEEDVEEHARASWWFCGICPGRKLDDHHDRPIFCFVSTRMVGGWMDGVGEEKRRDGGRGGFMGYTFSFRPCCTVNYMAGRAQQLKRRLGGTCR